MEGVCDMHSGERKTKFCREQGCWERLCERCVKERHLGHNVVDFAVLMGEVRAKEEEDIASKNKALFDLKQLLIDLDHLKKKFIEREEKLKMTEKKIQAKLEMQLKTINNKISTQNEKVQSKINIAIDYIKESKAYITQSLFNTTAIPSNIKEFLTRDTKENSLRVKKCAEAVREAKKAFKAFQEIEQTRSSSISRNKTPEISPKVNKLNKTFSHSSSKASILITNLMNLEFENVDKEEIQEVTERMRNTIEKLKVQITQKRTMLATLDTSIVSRSKYLETLKQKQGQLIKTNDSLKDNIMKQNKVLLTPNAGMAMIEVNDKQLYKEEVERITLSLKELTNKYFTSQEDLDIDTVIKQMDERLKECEEIKVKLIEKDKELEILKVELRY